MNYYCCLLGNHSALQGGMPLAGVKGACLLLRSELVANACNCSNMNLPEPWRCLWHVENRVTSMNPQHTSTACSTVVTEAVCVLLSTQPTLPHLTSSSAKKGPGPVFCVHGFSTPSARGAELFLSTTTTTVAVVNSPRTTPTIDQRLPQRRTELK